jgi:hypothetical protein
VLVAFGGKRAPRSRRAQRTDREATCPSRNYRSPAWDESLLRPGSGPERLPRPGSEPGSYAGGRRRWSSRAHIAEQAIPRLLIEIGGRAQAVLFLLVCDSATGLWPEHAVNLSTIKIIGLELLLKRR